MIFASRCRWRLVRLSRWQRHKRKLQPKTQEWPLKGQLTYRLMRIQPLRGTRTRRRSRNWPPSACALRTVGRPPGCRRSTRECALASGGTSPRTGRSAISTAPATPSTSTRPSSASASTAARSTSRPAAEAMERLEKSAAAAGAPRQSDHRPANRPGSRPWRLGVASR